MFVGGLSATTTAADVKAYFEQFGPVSVAFSYHVASITAHKPFCRTKAGRRRFRIVAWELILF